MSHRAMRRPLRPVAEAFGLAMTLAAGLACSIPAHAQREVRGEARTSVNRSVAANHNVNASRNLNATQNVNVNRNVNATQNVNVNRNVNATHNVNQNVNVNRNVNVVGRPVYVENDYHPFAAAAAVTAGVAVTAAAVGSIARSLPPSCSTAVVNGITYQNCSGTWYQPQYAGSQVTYVVVNPPR